MENPHGYLAAGKPPARGRHSRRLHRALIPSPTRLRTWALIVGAGAAIGAIGLATQETDWSPWPALGVSGIALAAFISTGKVRQVCWIILTAVVVSVVVSGLWAAQLQSPWHVAAAVGFLWFFPLAITSAANRSSRRRWVAATTLGVSTTCVAAFSVLQPGSIAALSAGLTLGAAGVVASQLVPSRPWSSWWAATLRLLGALSGWLRPSPETSERARIPDERDLPGQGAALPTPTVPSGPVDPENPPQVGGTQTTMRSIPPRDDEVHHMSSIPTIRIAAYIQHSDPAGVQVLLEGVRLDSSATVPLMVISDSGVWVVLDSHPGLPAAGGESRGSVSAHWVREATAVRDQVAFALRLPEQHIHLVSVDSRAAHQSCQVRMAVDADSSLTVHACSLSRLPHLFSAQPELGFDVTHALSAAMDVAAENRWVAWSSHSGMRETDVVVDPFDDDGKEGQPLWWNGEPVPGLGSNQRVTLLGVNGAMNGWVTASEPYQHQGWWLVDVRPSGDAAAPTATWPASCLDVAAAES